MDEHEDDLFWHALNYRTAAPQHAEAMWQELQACVARRVAAERKRWDGVEQYLVAAADGSMSRNNSEELAAELLAQIRGA